MKIPMTLNDKKIILDADPSEKLLDVLRREKLYSVKCGCEEGHCGNCMVLLDDLPAPSCLLSVGLLKDRNIETLEHFKSNPIYTDIIQGFSMAGIHLCGYCSAGKIFTAYNILNRFHRPDRAHIYAAINGLDLCCADRDTLANGILYAVAQRHAKENKTNGKK